MNRDFVEMLAALSAAGVEYLVVGAHALAAHGRPRSTGDLDLWVRPTEDNARRVWEGLVRFGAPIGDLTVQDLSTPDVVYQIGVVPCRIDILTAIDGVGFDEAWKARKTFEVEGMEVPVIGREHLIRNKRAAGRPQDLTDAGWLEENGE